MRGFPAVLLVATLIACKATEPARNAAEKATLVRNRAVWQQQGIRDYGFDYTLVANVNVPAAHITVRNNVVTLATRLSDGADVTNGYQWPTIDVLFARIATILDSPDGTAQVTYNPILGNPVTIDAPSMVPDAGYSASVEALTPAP